MPGATQKEGEWSVRDRNARQLRSDNSGEVIPRIHEVVPGVTYGLTFDKEYYMPERHARVFLKDAAFAVSDQNGNLVPPLSEQALSRDAPTTLPPNMVVADLHELTEEALLTRAAQLPGGSGFTASTPREVMIAFILDELTQTGTGRGVSRDLEDPDNDPDNMDDAATKRMLEGG